jgi:hypothetical protein
VFLNALTALASGDPGERVMIVVADAAAWRQITARVGALDLRRVLGYELLTRVLGTRDELNDLELEVLHYREHSIAVVAAFCIGKLMPRGGT